VPEPATEVFAAGAPTEAIDSSKVAAPQVIPPREDAPKPPPTRNRSWAGVVAVVLVIAALAALAILGTRAADPRRGRHRVAGGPGPGDHRELRRGHPEG
jgi:hypothetical protein